jgi:hypothetical protein
LDALVELGLQTIKYNGPTEWVGLIVDVLVDAIEKGRTFNRLRGMPVAGNADLSFSRPALVAYLGVRCMSTYAVKRCRFSYLREILPRFIRLFTTDNRSREFVPLVFRPLENGLLPDEHGGRNRTFWNEHIHSAWGSYFGTFDGFLSAASQLEFVLEFNSYLFVSRRDPQIDRLKQQPPDRCFDYEPDFWASRLDDVVPVAQRFHDILVAADTLPPEFAVDSRAFDAVFNGKTMQARLLILGGFLTHLTNWQTEVMRQFNRFPFRFVWGGALKQVADAFSEGMRAAK